MLRTKTIFLISCSVIISGCMSDSLQQFQSSSKTSNEITSSIRPASPLGTINHKDYEAWRNAYNAYNKQATAYWDQISAKRKLRNEKRARGQTIALTDYVLSQPPLYSGPAKPSTGKTTGPSRSIPGIDDFIAASKRVYGFQPERPSNESEFMRSYVNAAQEIGLNREQLVSIYAFETGGDGTHDLQSGMIKGKANARPISTAIGYNQLVATASVSLTAKAKTVPHNWGAQSELAKTDAGLGMHAMTMDKDVGPLLQIHKLRTSLTFLRRKGVSRPLSGAELEMLNLTGDGNGYDMVTMPSQYRTKVPTANFFLRPGYERNPVAIRNNTVAALLDATESKMEANMQKDGAQMLNRIYLSTTLARN